MNIKATKKMPPGQIVYRAPFLDEALRNRSADFLTSDRERSEISEAAIGGNLGVSFNHCQESFMNPFIPAWILGGPFVGLILLSFLFKGPSAMGGAAPRLMRGRDGAHMNANDPSIPLTDPIRAEAPRRLV